MISRDRKDHWTNRMGRSHANHFRFGFLKILVAGGAAIVAISLIAAYILGSDEAQAAIEPATQEVQLFNGSDLSGWESFLVEEGAQMEDVWSVEDGILVGQGEPQGYLYTENEYENFKLVVEWRWPEEPSNSGVLLRVTPGSEMLPNAIEAQLRSGGAGDMYGFQGFRIGGEADRLSEISIGWALGKMEGNENEPGEWNRYEITVDGDRITLFLNGKKVNEAWDCEVRPGRIALQSEGGLIHFRTVTLEPLGLE